MENDDITLWCSASSWRGKRSQGAYGPSNWHRCVWPLGQDQPHQDVYGAVFVTHPKFKVLQRGAPVGT